MADRFSETDNAQDSEFELQQESKTKLNWLAVQPESEKRTPSRLVDSVDAPNLEASGKDLFLSQRQNEPYSGYNDQLAADRKYLNSCADHLAECIEKGLGLGIGAWGIWAEKFRGSGKYLSKLEFNVNLTPIPTTEQAERLQQIKTQIESLAFAGRSTGVAGLKKEQEDLEKKILLRSKMISTGGLTAGALSTQAMDDLIFHKDSPGDGTFCADVIAAPTLSWIVPKNLVLKTGAIMGAHVLGKLYDHWLQPNYVYNPSDENKSALPTTQINQFRSPLIEESRARRQLNRAMMPHSDEASAEKSQLDEAEQLVWPHASSSPSITSNKAENNFIFTPEDIETQQANRERQRRDLKDQM